MPKFFHVTMLLRTLHWLTVKAHIHYKNMVLAPEWRSGLRHCISVLEAALQILVEFQAVSQPAVIGSPIGWHTISPVVRVRVWSR